MPSICVYIYIYIYIYIYAVKLLTGPSLGVFKVINWSMFLFKNSVCQRNIIK